MLYHGVMQFEARTTEKILYDATGELHPVEVSRLFDYCLGAGWDFSPNPSVRNFLAKLAAGSPSTPCLIEADVRYLIAPAVEYLVEPKKVISEAEFAVQFTNAWWGNTTLLQDDGIASLRTVVQDGFSLGEQRVNLKVEDVRYVT